MSDLQCPARVFVVRDAEAAYDTTEVTSDDGGRLTERGREQAAVLGARMREERIAHVYTSPMSRAVETGEILSQALGVTVTTLPGVQEFWVGQLAGADFERHRVIYERWLAGDLDARMPGAESGHELVARMTHALDYVSQLHRGEGVIVVSHGGVLSLTIPRIAVGSGVPLDTPPTVPHCGVLRLEVDGDGWRFSAPWPR
ncbi:MAG: histidine phosphatase family protein [Actinomycetales bacterium]|nr:histidine phosphatase family protein [Actinomycetales bacterium]